MPKTDTTAPTLGMEITRSFRKQRSPSWLDVFYQLSLVLFTYKVCYTTSRADHNLFKSNHEKVEAKAN